ncbi:MAG: AI-2E family transporter [Desulfocapsaceae bacterium]|nr:AI-2E family transporter [Desulfocapsaceae bacterium]
MEENTSNENTHFIALLTVALICASMYIFSPFLKYLLVAAVLALSTSHAFVAAVAFIENSSSLPNWIKRSKKVIVSTLFAAFFLMMIFTPLLYFLTVTFDQISALNIEEIKTTALDIWKRFMGLTENVPLLAELFQRLKTEGTSLINGASIEAVLKGGQNMFSGASGLIIQIGWILIFYFLFNLYGANILHFLATLMPTTIKHEKYLYKECTGTVAVVFYGSLFNMAAQGVAFGILMAFIGGYDSLYLGVLAGFCSIIPIIGAALVYIPVVVLELLHGNYLKAVIILLFAWTVMGFLIDNFLRIFFISNLKRIFGFEYTMNEVLILLSILAGIATLGFWGLIIGPSVIALTLAAANICRDIIGEDEHTPLTGC